MRLYHILTLIAALGFSTPVSAEIVHDSICKTDTCSRESFSLMQAVHLGITKAARGIGIGAKRAERGIEIGASHAERGLDIGLKHMGRGTIIGGRGTARGANETAQGLDIGFEATTTGVGRFIYNESKMFYQPSRELAPMDDLTFEEKALTVDEKITIYTYHFKCEYPKANIFLVHGNGGNVSTYKEEIRTLVSGGYNVYVVDWRGYGKSTGSPDYIGVMKDTEVAFDDFISQTQHDYLKTIVYGMSLGGQIATKLVHDRQQQVDALILDGSLSSAQNLAMDFMPAQFIRDNMKKNENLFNQDYIAERDIQQIVDIPKLIIHSATDNIVAFYHGERLYENAQHPKYFWKTNTIHIKTLEELPKEALNKINHLIDETSDWQDVQFH